MTLSAARRDGAVPVWRGGCERDGRRVEAGTKLPTNKILARWYCRDGVRDEARRGLRMVVDTVAV